MSLFSEVISNFGNFTQEFISIAHEIIKEIGELSEPIGLFLHSISDNNFKYIKTLLKLIIIFVSLFKLIFFWYMIKKFENKPINIDYLLNLVNSDKYVIMKKIIPFLSNSEFNNIDNIGHKFIKECRQITMEKSLPHYFIAKSLNIYTITKIFTAILLLYQLYKLYKSEKFENKEKNKEKNNNYLF